MDGVYRAVRFRSVYHPGKANVVANVLGRNTRCTLACLLYDDSEALRVFFEFGLDTIEPEGCISLFALEARPVMIEPVIESQKGNIRSQKFIDRANRGESIVWTVGTEGELRKRGRLYVPKAMREEVLRDLHQTRLAAHPDGRNMYHDLSHMY